MRYTVGFSILTLFPYCNFLNYCTLRYGGERYEKRELQLRVRQRFAELQAIDEATQKIPWHIVDASQSIEDVQNQINTIVEETMERVKNGKPLYKMFDDGEYLLPTLTTSSTGTDDNGDDGEKEGH